MKFEMSVFINERKRDGVAELMKVDLLCTSNDWLGTEMGIYSTKCNLF